MRTVSCVLAALVIAPVTLAQDAKAERVIHVTGTATVYAKPDTARIHYGVRVTEPSADAVKDVLGKTTKAIEDATKKLKLSSLTVSSAPMGIKQGGGNNAAVMAVPVPGGAAPAPGLGSLTGYTAHTATIVNSDPDKLRADVEAFVKAVTEAGANTGGGEPKDANFNVFPGQDNSDGPRVVLSRADDSAARAEALQKAVEKAVKSARAVAKGLGLDPAAIKVVSVIDTEPEKPAAEPFNIYAMLDGGSAPAKSNAGEVEVRVRVVVKCAY